MEDIKRATLNYHNGLLTAHEYLGQLIDIVGKAWESDDLKVAQDLADELVKRLKD